MGWQDRDYARETYSGWGRRVGGGPYRRGPVGWTAVQTILGVNIGVFVLAMLFNTGLGPQIYELGVMQVKAVWEGEAWRLLTSTYLHDPSSLMHILFNMMGLYFLGPPLEQRWGKRKFFVLYTIAGVLGNVFLMILARPDIGMIDPRVPALGASGSILGLLGACAVYFPRAEVYVYFLFPIKIRTAAIVYGLWYVLNIWQRGGNFGGDVCHLAGMIFGAWWAWQGDRLWSGGGFVGRSGGGGVPRSPQRASWKEVKQQERIEEEAVDRILRKVYDGGIHSLSPDERRLLTEATDRQRQEEVRAGRVDRL